jgi:DNA-binding CsgD family transcriptional regulator
MTDSESLQEISKKLSILIALHLQRDGKESVQENVSRLSRFGLTTGEIAEILGTTPGTVAVTKSRIKNKRR